MCCMGEIREMYHLTRINTSAKSVAASASSVGKKGRRAQKCRISAALGIQKEFSFRNCRAPIRRTKIVSADKKKSGGREQEEEEILPSTSKVLFVLYCWQRPYSNSNCQSTDWRQRRGKVRLLSRSVLIFFRCKVSLGSIGLWAFFSFSLYTVARRRSCALQDASPRRQCWLFLFYDLF
jgi:hypothetical protein